MIIYPVFGRQYIQPKNKHFVIYSPAWVYNWPTSLIADTRYLWIGTRGEGIVRYDKLKSCLLRISLQFEGVALLDIDYLRLMGDFVEVNRKALFRRDVPAREK